MKTLLIWPHFYGSNSNILDFQFKHPEIQGCIQTRLATMLMIFLWNLHFLVPGTPLPLLCHRWSSSSLALLNSSSDPSGRVMLHFATPLLDPNTVQPLLQPWYTSRMETRNIHIRHRQTVRRVQCFAKQECFLNQCLSFETQTYVWRLILKTSIDCFKGVESKLFIPWIVDVGPKVKQQAVSKCFDDLDTSTIWEPYLLRQMFRLVSRLVLFLATNFGYRLEGTFGF